MTVIGLREVSVATCILSSASFGFHPSLRLRSPLAVPTTVFRRTSLFYKNKTEEFFDLPSAIATDDMKYSAWGLYQAGVTSQVHSRYSEVDHGTNYDADLDAWPTTDFYEDGTAFVPMEPTLELLQSWTQEYMDAVDLAGGMTRISVGVQHMLSSEFVFTSPTIGPLNKEDFVKLMDYYRHCGFDLASAIPDLKVTYDGWHLDPHQPWRVWVVARYAGTHLGTAVVPGTDLKLTPPNTGDHELYFTSGPEMQSFLWTPDKEILWQTMGYVGDEYTGSNQGYGGLDGLLVSMGLPHLYLDAISPMRKVKNWISQFQTHSGETMARAKTPYSGLPQWWNERKTYDLNVHK